MTTQILQGDEHKPAVDSVPERWRRYDVPSIQSKLVYTQPGTQQNQIIISSDAIHCASCSLLIEREMGKISGVTGIDVNATNRRVYLSWQPQTVQLSTLLHTMDKLGFTPKPLGEESEQATIENRTALKRIFVAAIGMMQVMMYAVGLYAGAFQGMERSMQVFLHIVSMVVATPVVLYSGFPFFKSAWRDLSHGQAGMDVPVALAIGSAYLASIYAVATGLDHVYFDSVTMFIFFLSLGRFFEMKARHRTGTLTAAMANLLPITATRLAEDNQEHIVAIDELQIGDLIKIKAGETVPIDCRIISGTTQVDESLLTGESKPLTKTVDDLLIGGSNNHSGLIVAQVEKVGDDTVVSHIKRLLQRAQSERPAISRLADYVARYFVAGVLFLACCVGIFWWQTQADRAFEIVLAVLVVTCPCALSLATPAALTVAVGRLAKEGLLATRSDAIELLAAANYAVFDKTGTLTFGHLNIRNTITTAELDKTTCLNIAAAMEKHSEHPIAMAFEAFSGPAVAEQTKVYPGLGLEAQVTYANQSTCFRIGKQEFVAALGSSKASEQPQGALESSWIALGNQQQIIAWFELGDIPRPNLGTMFAQLKALKLEMEVLSGDQPQALEHLTQPFGLRGRAQLTPDGKLNYIQTLQTNGEKVLMLGDGINDAPVLAGADVSIALSSGTDLAQTSADMVLLDNSLPRLPLAISIARRTLSIIKQNISWAIGYNVIALPLAAMGLIAPWLAAIGMSTSSLLVVLNALRLGKKGNEKS